MFSSRFMPCSDCGESVERDAIRPHRCDPERRAAYQVFGMRDEIDTFEERLRDFLHTATGRFEVWLAARHVCRSVRE